MFILVLLNLITNTHAGLPDYEVTLQVPNLTFSLCGQGYDVAVPFTPPNPAYDHVQTVWNTGLKYYMYGTNNDPIESTFYLGFYNFLIQADFEIQNQTHWTSTTVLYHERHGLNLQPGIPDGVIKTKRWTYDSLANVNGYQFQNNYVNFRCYVGQVNPIQNYNGSSGWGVLSMGGTLKLIFKDLNP